MKQEIFVNWLSISRIIGVVGKIAIVMIMMGIAICMYRQKYQKWTAVPVLFFFYILAVSICPFPLIKHEFV